MVGAQRAALQLRERLPYALSRDASTLSYIYSVGPVELVVSEWAVRQLPVLSPPSLKDTVFGRLESEVVMPATLCHESISQAIRGISGNRGRNTMDRSPWRP